MNGAFKQEFGTLKRELSFERIKNKFRKINPLKATLIGGVVASVSAACIFDLSGYSTYQLRIVEPPATIWTSNRTACEYHGITAAGIVLYIREPKTEERLRSSLRASQGYSVRVEVSNYEDKNMFRIEAQKCSKNSCAQMVDVEKVIFPNGHKWVEKPIELVKAQPDDKPCNTIKVTIPSKD